MKRRNSDMFSIFSRNNFKLFNISALLTLAFYALVGAEGAKNPLKGIPLGIAASFRVSSSRTLPVTKESQPSHFFRRNINFK